MKNVKTYLFIAAVVILSGVVGFNTIKPEVKATHDIITKSATENTTNINRRGYENTTTTNITETPECLEKICIDFKYDSGKAIIDADTVKKYIRNYGCWAGQSCGYIDKYDPNNPGIKPGELNGLLGWNIPFGDIKALIDKYIVWKDRSNSDSVGFAVYITLTETTHLYKAANSAISTNIKNGMKDTHLLLVLTVDGIEKPELGYRDLITPCPKMCDKNRTLADCYRNSYNEGYFNDFTSMK